MSGGVVTDSPHEYIERLREENKLLRASVVQLAAEKRVLEDVIARQNAYVVAAAQARGEDPPERKQRTS